MRVRLKRDWKGYKAQRVLNPNDGVANVLISRGIAVLLDGPKPKVKPKSKSKAKPKTEEPDAVRTDSNDSTDE